MDGAKFETFEGEGEASGQHFWRLRGAHGGQIIAIGGEGYATKGGAIRAIAGVKRAVAGVLGDETAMLGEARAKAAEPGATLTPEEEALATDEAQGQEETP